MRIEMFYYPNNKGITLDQALKEVGSCDGLKVRYYDNGIAIFATYQDGGYRE